MKRISSALTSVGLATYFGSTARYIIWRKFAV